MKESFSTSIKRPEVETTKSAGPAGATKRARPRELVRHWGKKRVRLILAGRCTGGEEGQGPRKNAWGRMEPSHL